MKKVIGFCMAALMATVLTAHAETFEKVDLPAERTSVDYAGPIKDVTKVIEGHKWLGQTQYMNGGVEFEAYDNPQFGKTDAPVGSLVMIKATFYTYEKVSKESIMAVRQSEIKGFVELYDYENPELQLHVRIVNDNEFQAFNSVYDYKKPHKLFTYKTVEQFNKSPYGERIKSASESGMIF
jgi:hypothetical protein